MSVSTLEPDPYAVLDAWLSGTWERSDGQTVLGQIWDPDTAYRYDTWIRSWLIFIDNLAWTFEPIHVATWASGLRNLDGTPMGQSGRARAASAVRSFYRHCEENLGASSWGLPRRWKLVGTVKATQPQRLPDEHMQALRDAAAAYRGPHAERGRLATYLLLAGLRPGQAIALDLRHIRQTTADGPVWRLPAKNASASAVAAWSPMPGPVAWALSLYLPVRTWKAPHSGEDWGPAVVTASRDTSREGIRGGQAFTRTRFAPLVRAVAATHPDLEEMAPTLRMDHIAHSTSPFT